jgi:putative transcriptional regulator
MKKELFDEPLESVREGGAILRGDAKASRTFSVQEADVRSLREKHGLSQPKFAARAQLKTSNLDSTTAG